MSTQHTPGPWSIAPQIAHEGLWVESAGDEPEEICLCSPATVPSDECRANARLIAAAPELLDALEGFHPKNTKAPGDLARAWEKARAAIAKARGGAL